MVKAVNTRKGENNKPNPLYGGCNDRAGGENRVLRRFLALHRLQIEGGRERSEGGKQ